MSKKPVVVIGDPGHGLPRDPGAIGGGLKEAQMVLLFMWRVLWYLREYWGIKTDTTREKGEYKTLGQRVAKAKWWVKQGYRVINLSFHLNGSLSKKARGHEVLYFLMWPNRKYNRNFAQRINEALARAYKNAGVSIPDRGVKRRWGLYVLKWMPRSVINVLVEFLFITSPEDRKIMLDPKVQDAVARELAIAIAKEAGVKQIKAFDNQEKLWEVRMRFRGHGELGTAKAVFDDAGYEYEIVEVK